MVSTLDFESSDPSSNLGGTFAVLQVTVYSWVLAVVRALAADPMSCVC